MQFIKQRSHDGCALACLDMILLSNGINLTYEKLLIFSGGKRKLSFNDFNDILTKNGIKSQCFKSKTRNLVDYRLFQKALFHYKNHFYIVGMENSNYITIYDPARLFAKKVSIKKFKYKWDGYFMTFDSELNNPLMIPRFYVSYQFKLVLIDIVLILFLIIVFNLL